MMDKMKDMKTKKRTLKKEEKKESETEYVIRAENVDYTYEGSKIKALDHLSLNIRKGKKVAVMGGNGCGKSTFFLCLNGIRRPESGRIFIDGLKICQMVMYSCLVPLATRKRLSNSKVKLIRW